MPDVRISNLPARSTVDAASLIPVVDLATNTTVRVSISRLAEILGLADQDMLDTLEAALRSDSTKKVLDLRSDISDDRRFAGIVRLENATGTNTIRAELPQEALDLGIDIGNGSYVLLRPANDTTDNQPTLQVNGGFIRTIRDEDQKDLSGKRLRGGVTYLLRLESNGAYRLMAAFPTIGQHEDMTAAVPRSVDAYNTSERLVDRVPPVGVAMQRDGKMPARPSAHVVHWHCWDDPTAFMIGADLWIQHEPPTLPRALTAAQVEVVPNHVSGQIAFRLDPAVLFEHAEVKRIEYRVNGGSVISIEAPVGENWRVISGLSNSSPSGVEVRLVNYLGAGPWSPAVSAQPNPVAYFQEDFTRANQPLVNSRDWEDMPLRSVTGQLEINGNVLRPSKTNHQQQARVVRPMGADQFAEATYLVGSNNNNKAARVCVRMSGPSTYYALHASRYRWALLRFKNSELADYAEATVLAEGARNSQSTWEVFRIEAQGDVVRAFESGALLAAVRDRLPLTGGAAGVSLESSGSGGLSETRIDNFRSGNL